MIYNTPEEGMVRARQLAEGKLWPGESVLRVDMIGLDDADPIKPQRHARRVVQGNMDTKDRWYIAWVGADMTDHITPGVYRVLRLQDTITESTRTYRFRVVTARGRLAQVPGSEHAVTYATGAASQPGVDDTQLIVNEHVLPTGKIRRQLQWSQ